MRFPVIISAFIHVLIIFMITHGMSFKDDDTLDVPPPINIDIVDIAEFNQTKKIAPPIPKKEEPKEEPQERTKPKIPPKAIAKPSAPVEPERKEIAVPLPDEKAEIIEKKEETKEPPKNPVKKPTLKDTVPPKQEETDDQFKSVLKNLIGEQPFVNAETEQEQQASEPTQVATLGDRITISEMDALRRQLEGCWNVPIGARDADNLIVDVRIDVNPDRTVKSAQIEDMSRYNSDTFFRAAADSALRAVLSDACNPLILPEGKYNQWKVITFRFNPKEMF